MPNWKADSVFGLGPRVLLEPADAALYRARLHLSAYRCRGKLTLAAAAVGRVLIDMQGPDGRLDPSRRTLAALAAVSLRTVDRALDRLRTLGFVTWTRRLVRDERSQWRCAQTSSAYVLRVPPACERHSVAQDSTRVFKGAAPVRSSRSELSWVAAEDAAGRESAARQLVLLGYPDETARMQP